jgi:hypothetical protein
MGNIMGPRPQDPFDISTKKTKIVQTPNESLSCLQFDKLCFHFSMLSL